MQCRSVARWLAVFSWLHVVPLLAQTTTASLSGRVLDSTGAVLPGATLS